MTARWTNSRIREGRFPPEKQRRGGIFLLVIALHAIIFYCVYVQRLHQTKSHAEGEIAIGLIWIKPDPEFKPPEPVQPPPPSELPPPAPKARSNPTRPPAIPPPPVAVALPKPTIEKRSEASGKKPLDLLQILKDVDTDTRKFDHDHPDDPGMRAAPVQPSFESKLGAVISNATPRPKFYEPVRTEEISSGAQLNAGIRMYKITTFAGSYCVTYYGGGPGVIGGCPTKF